MDSVAVPARVVTHHLPYAVRLLARAQLRLFGSHILQHLFHSIAMKGWSFESPAELIYHALYFGHSASLWNAYALSPPGKRRWPRLHWLPGVVFRINHDAPPTCLAGAFRLEISLVAQRQVNHAPLARSHGSEQVRHSRLADAFRCYRRRCPQLLEPRSAVIQAVENHFVMLAGPEPQHLLGKVLEGAKQLG